MSAAGRIPCSSQPRTRCGKHLRVYQHVARSCATSIDQGRGAASSNLTCGILILAHDIRISILVSCQINYIDQSRTERTIRRESVAYEPCCPNQRPDVAPPVPAFRRTRQYPAGAVARYAGPCGGGRIPVPRSIPTLESVTGQRVETFPHHGDAGVSGTDGSGPDRGAPA